MSKIKYNHGQQMHVERLNIGWRIISETGAWRGIWSGVYLCR